MHKGTYEQTISRLSFSCCGLLRSYCTRKAFPLYNLIRTVCVERETCCEETKCIMVLSSTMDCEESEMLTLCKYLDFRDDHFGTTDTRIRTRLQEGWELPR
jgi:hypothetical protein